MTEKQKRKGLSLSGLSTREKRLVAGMLAVFAIIAIFIPVTIFQRSMDDIDTEARKYKQSLDLIAMAGPQYLEKKAKGGATESHKKIDEEVLANNPVKLTSFVAEHAEATQLTVSSYDEDEMPFGSGKQEDGPMIVEKQVRVEIRDAEMTKLVNLLDRIEKSTDPVFIKRLDVRAQRKKPGQVRAVLTVSTFVRKEKRG